VRRGGGSGEGKGEQSECGEEGEEGEEGRGRGGFHEGVLQEEERRMGLILT